MISHPINQPMAVDTLQGYLETYADLVLEPRILWLHYRNPVKR